MQLFEKSFPGISEIIENCRNSIEKETEVYFEQAADACNKNSSFYTACNI